MFIEKHKKEAEDKFSATRVSFPNVEAQNNWESQNLRNMVEEAVNLNTLSRITIADCPQVDEFSMAKLSNQNNIVKIPSINSPREVNGLPLIKSTNIGNLNFMGS